MFPAFTAAATIVRDYSSSFRNNFARDLRVSYLRPCGKQGLCRRKLVVFGPSAAAKLAPGKIVLSQMFWALAFLPI
jgi:hypothetical protein